MHHGVSFDKIQPKQVGYFGTWINWKQRQKIENSVSPLAAPRRGLVLQVPHCLFYQFQLPLVVFFPIVM
jgi:hypothetical protein